MNVRQLFSTPLYQAKLEDAPLLRRLAQTVRRLAAEDAEGRKWSSECGYKGYTSYASIRDLERKQEPFRELAPQLSREASKFCTACAFDIDRAPYLDHLWVNLLPSSGHQRAHIHPASIITGTLYLEVPPGAGAICFEDPRLPLMMAAPPRANGAPEYLRSVVTVEPCAGLILLWESWLRHEVLPGSGTGERISVSFNFS